MAVYQFFLFIQIDKKELTYAVEQVNSLPEKFANVIHRKAKGLRLINNNRAITLRCQWQGREEAILGRVWGTIKSMETPQ